MKELILRAWRWAWRVGDSFDAHFGGLMAAAISFFALLSVVPLLSVGVAILGWVLGGSREALAHLEKVLAAYLPTSGTLIYQTLGQIKRDSGIVGLIGLAGLLYSGSAIYTNLEEAFNNIWGVQQGRRWLKGHVYALLTTILTLVLMAVSIGVTSALTWIQNTRVPGVDFRASSVPFVWAAVAQLSTLAVSSLMFGLMYKIIPNKAIPWREAIVGGLFTGTAWELAKYLFALYLAHFGNYNKIYGSLGSLMMLVMWTYYSATILFIGAEIAADYGIQLRKAHGEPVNPAAAQPDTGTPAED